MRKGLVLVVAIAVVAAGAWLPLRRRDQRGDAGGRVVRGRGPPRRRPGGRPAMTVATAAAGRRQIIDYTSVVGNLIGALTVDVVPRVAGRIESVGVQLGDRVTKGQPIVKIEDREYKLQISQAEANLQVNEANVTQRENDLKVAESTAARVQAMFDQGLQSKQNLEDAQARVNSLKSQLLATQSQLVQTQARIDELKVTLSNTSVASPVDGFVSRRNLDPGAFAGANTVILSVVDISTVRLVANIVERDFKRVKPGVEARVEVDAFPGEHFTGQVSRVAPVFDPTTRTATIEIEVPNPGFRLKPGMYARVRLTVEQKPNALAVPRNAVVDVDGQRGVFLIEESTARFHAVTTGLSDGEYIEVIDGLNDGERVVTTGALALRDGDRITLAEAAGRQGGGRQGGSAPSGGGPGTSGAPGAPAAGSGR
ncbi:MAG: efflux RND transporter periplasmic adaptor subunit [Vicinamibacterales bacterium]